MSQITRIDHVPDSVHTTQVTVTAPHSDEPVTISAQPDITFLLPLPATSSKQLTAVSVVPTRSGTLSRGVTLATITVTQSAQIIASTVALTSETASSIDNASSQTQGPITTTSTSATSTTTATSESSNPNSDGRVKQLIAVAIAAPTAVVLVLLIVSLVVFYLRRQRRQRMKVGEDKGALQVASMSQNLDANVHPLERGTELDSTQRYETEARVRKQELGTDRGGGNRGHATGMERIVKRLIGKTAELDGSQENKETSMVERVHELEA